MAFVVLYMGDKKAPNIGGWLGLLGVRPSASGRLVSLKVRCYEIYLG